MLKVRIIPCLTIKDLRLVKSIQFINHRNIGSYISSVRVFNARDVDEMIFLDLDASHDGIKAWLIKEVTKECFMPLTIGGGIKTIEDIRQVLKLGADKISINSAALSDPQFISRASNIFGKQCIVVSIDAKRIGANFKVFADGGQNETNWTTEKWAKEVARLGAGEILLTSIDRDGVMKGYDTELISLVTKKVSVPVIANGGAGNLNDFKLAINKGASAVAAASIFQYTQATPFSIKRHLKRSGI